MTKWILVSLIVVSTVLSDLLQSFEMKRHGEIHEFHPRGIRRHFFVFMKLVSVADLSFAVPATAASFVLETILAKLILKERVDVRRWAGAALVAFGVALLAR